MTSLHNETNSIDIETSCRCEQMRKRAYRARSFRFKELLIAMALLPSYVDGFDLSMISRTPSTARSRTFQQRRVSQLPSVASKYPTATSFPSPKTFDPSKAFDITSTLVSKLAVMAIKFRLAGHEDVSCDVSSKPADMLLGGKVGPVTVKGQGWRSSRGLTCRAIEASVDSCYIDIAKIMSDQRVVLTKPTKGEAMVAFNSEDFGSFLSHPRMELPGGLQFLSQGIVIDPVKGTVTFGMTSSDSIFTCTLRRGASNSRRAMVEVKNDEDQAISEPLSDLLSNFFNDMVFELDGTFLSFKDIMVSNKRGSPIVVLSLNIVVNKFPSPGIDF